VERQQVRDVILRSPPRQFSKHMAQVHERFHAAGAACQHQAVDDRAGLRAGHRVGEQPRLPAGTERADVTLDEVVVNRRGAIVDVAAQDSG
jgi:hypothetical protein